MAEPQQAQLYYEDGSPIPVGEVGQAVKEGKAYSTGESVSVKRGNRTVEIGTDKLANLLAAGGEVETTQQAHKRELKKDAESFGGMAATAGEGLVRGATLGFGALENFYDSEGREKALARQELNPYLSGGSELAGAVGGGALATLLSGGAGGAAAAEGAGGALARLGGRAALSPWMVAEGLGGAAARGAGAIAGEGLLGKAAQLGARGLAEGAVMGAGHEVSQAALSDVPLTAERLLAGAWDGAEAGGLLGGGIGLLGGVAGKGVRALRGKASEALAGVAETAAGKAIGKGSPELGRELLKYEFQNGEKLLRAGDRAEDIAARVGMARQETTQQLSAMRSQLDDAFAKLPQPDLGGAVARADEVLQPLRSSPVPAVRAQAARLDDQLAGLREAASGEPIAVKLPDGSSSTAAREPLSFGQLEQLRESVKLPAGASPEVSAAFEQVGRAISKPMEAAEAALGPAAKDYRAAQQRLARLEQAEAIAKAVPQEQGGMLSGLGMGTVMSALTGNVGGVAAGAVSGLANKLVAERGKSVLAVMADRASQATQRVDSAARVAALVDKPSRLAAPVAVNVARMFERYTKDLDKSDDEVADGLGELTAQLQYASPEMAAAVTERALADRAYLKSIAPQPTTNANQTLTPKATKASYSFDQKKQFVDSAVALEKPLSVFEDIARGDLPLSKIEALKERRPLLFQEMRSTVVRYTVERDEELPYPRRMLLGVAFGFPSDWSIANVTTIQESLAPPDKAQTDPTAAPSKVTDEPGAAIEPGGF